MILEFLELFKNRKNFSNFEEKLKWVSRLFVWSEKMNEKKLENLAFEYINSNNSLRNFDNLIQELEKVKENYSTKRIFIVFGHDNLIGDVKKIVKSLGFEPCFFSLGEIVSNSQSSTILEIILEQLRKSVLVIVILALNDEKIKDIYNCYLPYLQPRLNVVMELGMSIAILGIKRTLVLWDQRIDRRNLTDFGGYPTINLDNEKEWKKNLKFNLMRLKELI